MARAPSQLAVGLAHAMRDAPDERLDQLMQTPVRRMVLEAVFWQLSQRFDGAVAATIDASIRWRITGRSDQRVDVYDLELAEGRCRAVRGPTDREPQLTITVDIVELLRLATGDSDPLRGYLRGGLALSGDVILAAKLAWLARSPLIGRSRDA